MNRQDGYAKLIARRRTCTACAGVCNPATVAQGAFDQAEIGPWTKWQGRLDAPVFVVGQDFSDRKYFEKWKGEDRPNNTTNMNLIKLFASIGIDIREPSQGGDRGEAFFTNAILCLKEGGMQAKVRAEWFVNCGSRFLRPQIELVQPRVVVGLGSRAHNAVLSAFGFPQERLRDAVRSEGTPLPGGAIAIAVYHCGARVININRGLDEQMADWKRVRRTLGASAV